MSFATGLRFDTDSVASFNQPMTFSSDSVNVATSSVLVVLNRLDCDPALVSVDYTNDNARVRKWQWPTVICQPVTLPRVFNPKSAERV
jgi:hypothetical protein